MLINNLLLWEKWRPSKIEDIILPDRITNHFRNGITKNFIFYGNYGTGKTSLARILIGKYSGDKAFLELNSSLYTSIDVLRNEIEKFCKTVPMFETEDPIKYVFLDEFDRVSVQYQDAMKAFIERYHNNVRFILTTNHYNKISEGIKSRFTSINFDALNKEEEKFIKTGIYKKVMQIAESEKIDLKREVLINIINKQFPDLRSIIVQLQNIKDTGDISLSSSMISNKLIMDTYDIIYDKSTDYEKIYHFLMSAYGPDNIDQLFNVLGRNFIDFSLKEKRNLDSLFKCNYVISELREKLETKTDPLILGMTLIGKFRDILN
jgi:putative ATPase